MCTVIIGVSYCSILSDCNWLMDWRCRLHDVGDQRTAVDCANSNSSTGMATCPQRPWSCWHCTDWLWKDVISKLDKLHLFTLVYVFAWHPQLHTLYISSPNHCLLFAAHAHTFAAFFAVVPRLCRLCHLILVSQPLLGTLIL